SPSANAAVAQYFGESPSNPKACALAAKGFCDTYHAGDAAYAAKIHYWNTPTASCLDGRKNVTCTTYQQWTQAWTEIKAQPADVDTGTGAVRSDPASRRPAPPSPVATGA